jgi:hypothetical protein
MAKKKSAAGEAERGGQAGTDGDQIKRRLSATKRKPRSWTFEMILADPPTKFDDHPLAGLSPEQRDDMRAQAFGRVLAAIAARKAESQGRHRDTADEQCPSIPKSSMPKNG